MTHAVRAGFTPSTSGEVTIPARPEALTVKPAETAVIVVDMQNAYATQGGYVDLAGFDVSGAAAAVAQTKKVIEAARAAGILVIFFQNGWDKDYVEAGGPGSPNWHKSNALKTMRARPELARHAAGKRHVGLRPGRRTGAAARRHRHSQDPLQRLLQHQYRQRAALTRNPHPRVHRRRHQRLRGVVAARRLPPRIFRRRARGRHPSSGTGLHSESPRLQRRKILRLGLHRRRLLRSRFANPSFQPLKEPPCRKQP